MTYIESEACRRLSRWRGWTVAGCPTEASLAWVGTSQLVAPWERTQAQDCHRSGVAPSWKARRDPPRDWLYCPSIPFFRSALGGLGPSHTENSTGPKAGPVMVSFSAPLMAKVVPVPGT
jgi:hypothetical protein